jgi:hypothetical protein
LTAYKDDVELATGKEIIFVEHDFEDEKANAGWACQQPLAMTTKAAAIVDAIR